VKRLLEAAVYVALAIQDNYDLHILFEDVPKEIKVQVGCTKQVEAQTTNERIYLGI
jgi:hypothetical protein